MREGTCHGTNKKETVDLHQLTFVLRNLTKFPTECKKTAYAALVRSTLEYGAVVWDPFLEKDILKLEKINRKAARFIKGDFKTRTRVCYKNDV